MKVTEKKLDDGRILLEAVVSTAEVGHALAVAHNGFAQQMGVRVQPGVPVAQAVEQQLGVKDLDSLVAQQAVEYLVPFAIDKSNIAPAFIPQPKTSAPLKRGQTFSFELRVTPKPAYELKSYDPVTITVPPFQIPEGEVDAQLAQMAESYAQYVADEPHPVGPSDGVLISLEAFQDGKRLDNLSTDARTYVMGMNLMPEGFEKNLLGMEVGQTKSFSFDMPGAPEGQDPDVFDCTVTVKELQKKVVPQIDDEWVAKFMPLYRDAAALRGALTEAVQSQHRAQHHEMLLQAAAAELSKRFQGSIADEVYEFTRDTMLANLRGSLQQQGIPFEQYIQNYGGEQQFGMIMMMQTRELLVQGYSLDALFRHEKMSLEDKDIERACRQMNPMDPKAARREMEENGRGFALREAAERMKANEWLLEHAVVNEEGTKTA
ncbi:trigger factor [Rubneribacter sp.]